MKPLIKYRGGKSKELHNIVQHIPHFTGRYIEPFFGGGALFFHLNPEAAIINDINSKLMLFYKGVKEDFINLKSELALLQKQYDQNRHKFEGLKLRSPNDRVEDLNEELYYQIRDMFNGTVESQYSDALLYYFINKTAYSGMIRYNSKGEFNVPFGRYKNFNTSLVTLEHHELLRNTDIYNEDYKTIFRMANEDDFIFLDPPYDCVFSDYGNKEYKEGFNDDAHRVLANDFRELKSPALMVIGKTPLTEELYSDLIIDEYDKSYAVNIRNRFKSAAKHILIANY